MTLFMPDLEGMKLEAIVVSLCRECYCSNIDGLTTDEIYNFIVEIKID